MKRTASLLTVALVMGACTSSEPVASTTTTAVPATTTTTSGETWDLLYGYEPDTTLEYDTDVVQRVRFTAEGDAGAFTSDEVPIEGDLTSKVEAPTVYSIFSGPQDGTFEIEISADFSAARVEGTVNGEPVDTEDDGELESELAVIGPVDTTVIVDDIGNIISTGATDIGAMGADMAALARLSGDRLGVPIGPAFPSDRSLSVGDSWSHERADLGPDGPVSTRSTHRLAGIEEMDGTRVLRIESTEETDGFTHDYTEMFKQLFTGFAGLEDGEDIPAELQELLDQIEFIRDIAPSSSTSTAWFDPEAGLVLRIETVRVISWSMLFRAPDEEAGGVSEFTLEVTIDQSVDHDLAASG